MKTLNKAASGIIAAAAATSAVLAMSATSATALATSYTPTGTTANFVGSGVSFTDIEAGQTLSCDQFDLAGSVIDSGVSRAYGVDAGSLGTLTSDNCQNVLAGATTVTPTGTWGVTVTGDPTGTEWPAQLTNVGASLSAADCNFDVAGVVNGSFDTADQTFTPAAGASGLTITDIPAPTAQDPQTMCVTLDLVEGDTVAVDGAWTNDGPALALANP